MATGPLGTERRRLSCLQHIKEQFHCKHTWNQCGMDPCTTLPGDLSDQCGNNIVH